MRNEETMILVVEDDEPIRFGLEENLKAAGYAVTSAADGPTALAAASTTHPDLILLDVMLPELSGYEVCRRLRDRNLAIPVIMLTARDEPFDKVHGFEMGADDYVTKPFSLQELLARIKAVLARGRARRDTGGTLTFADCELDLQARTLSRGGQSVTVTRTEFDLLVYFFEHAGEALSREQVMHDVWGTEYLGTQRSLDSFVANLRRKIEPDPHNPVHILTLHGVGYKFVRDTGGNREGGGA